MSATALLNTVSLIADELDTAKFVAHAEVEMERVCYEDEDDVCLEHDRIEAAVLTASSIHRHGAAIVCTGRDGRPYYL